MSPTSTKLHSTLSLLLRVWGKLSRRRRIQLWMLFFVMLASGGAELVSLGAVIPFLAVLSAPEQLWQHPLIQVFVGRVSLTRPEQLVLPATEFFVAAALLAATVRLSNLWLTGRLAAAIGSDLSSDAYQYILNQPYGVHVQSNSSTFIHTITTKVGRTVDAIKVTLLMATSAVVSLVLLSGLLLLDWKVAMASAGLFGSAYALIAFITRSKLRRNGDMFAAAGVQLLKAVQEGIGAIRDVLLQGSQSTYVDIYLRADKQQRQLSADSDFLVLFPRYAMEALGMVVIAVLGCLLTQQQGSGGSVIPLLGALALGSQRLLPALQQSYHGWASLKYYNSDLSEVVEVLEQPTPPKFKATAPMCFVNSIQFQGVRFRYAPEMPEVLMGMDLQIRRGERIGIIGSTGCGKSTMVDLLMGLLVPTGGQILVDGHDINHPQHPERMAAWRLAIAQVPQAIYLTDSTIAENIAFGIPKPQIDMDRVQAVAKQAQIAGYIESSAHGYHSLVGERGIRLSGGQRQRLGIARALYKHATVLVFDEATSALDSQVEKEVMQAIQNLSQDLTIILIAHRVSTLQFCDRIINLGV